MKLWIRSLLTVLVFENLGPDSLPQDRGDGASNFPLTAVLHFSSAQVTEFGQPWEVGGKEECSHPIKPREWDFNLSAAQWRVGTTHMRIPSAGPAWGFFCRAQMGATMSFHPCIGNWGGPTFKGKFTVIVGPQRYERMNWLHQRIKCRSAGSSESQT